MMPTMRRLLQPTLLGALLAVFILALGCRGPQSPDPSMTAVRGGGDGERESADWISPEDIDRAESLGLGMRDSSMTGSDAMDNRVENLFEPVYFEFDQSFIRPADRPILQDVAQYLQQNPEYRLLIEGHCDWRGTTEYNMTLGDRRARSAYSYLESLGLSTDRMETVSKGDLEAVTEGTEEDMRLDRRADLIILQ